jgi:hypothetical protein
MTGTDLSGVGVLVVESQIARLTPCDGQSDAH